MVYLEPETYLEYRQTSTMERFAKNTYLARLKKVFIFSGNGTFWL